jgi:hypothetical protein
MLGGGTQQWYCRVRVTVFNSGAGVHTQWQVQKLQPQAEDSDGLLVGPDSRPGLRVAGRARPRRRWPGRGGEKLRLAVHPALASRSFDRGMRQRARPGMCH